MRNADLLLIRTLKVALGGFKAGLAIEQSTESCWCRRPRGRECAVTAVDWTAALQLMTGLQLSPVSPWSTAADITCCGRRITVRQLEALVRLSEALARLRCTEKITPTYVREVCGVPVYPSPFIPCLHAVL